MIRLEGVYDSTDRQSVSRGRDGAPANTTNVIRDTTPSRGRDLISTGRGGAGNIVRSPSRDFDPDSKGHVNSAEVASRALSTGRGGASNIRGPSASRDSPTHGRTDGANGVDKDSVEYEREVLARHREAEARKGVQSTGRGGAGNILPSHTPSPHRSTSRSRAPPTVHSTGRGGAGNLLAGGPNDAALEQLDEHERLGVRHSVDAVHSAGRGGLANLAPGPQDDLEGHRHHPKGQSHLESSGRGGAGNILHRSREGRGGSRDREGKDQDAGAGAVRAGSRERLGKMWNNLKHHGHGGHQHHEDHESIQEIAGEN
ncbi:hypothetical protein FIBSPDRAFT_931954 [Athelia psychrophila]|uniref:Uncharacterized protein n=1 Tax=Athelia psychrophila TaxID=1759441 RepID=A0A166JJT1_9AGAM|nr:hypothetical protein FIBSPDRAFT_931954 [Fibularhizoctonia sp. CBS 109695]